MTKHQRDLIRKHFNAYDIRFMPNGTVMNQTEPGRWSVLLTKQQVESLLRTYAAVAPSRRFFR